MYLDLNKNQPTKGYNVNKSELIDAVAESADLSKADSGRAIDAVIDAITNSLKKEESVVLVGFGTFQTKKQGSTNGT